MKPSTIDEVNQAIRGHYILKQAEEGDLSGIVRDVGLGAGGLGVAGLAGLLAHRTKGLGRVLSGAGDAAYATTRSLGKADDVMGNADEVLSGAKGAIRALSGSATKTLGKADGVLGNADEVLSGAKGAVKGLSGSAAKTLGNADEVLSGAKGVLGDVGGEAGDVLGRMKALLGDLPEGGSDSSTLSKTMERLNDILRGVQEKGVGVGPLKIVKPTV